MSEHGARRERAMPSDPVIVQQLAELSSQLRREGRDDDADVTLNAIVAIRSLEMHRIMYERAMPSDLSNDMLRRVWRRADEITLAEHPGEQPAGEWDEVPQQHRGVFRSIVQATSEELRAAHHADALPCVWHDDGEYYATECGNAFTIIAGTPQENDMRYCCYCGREIADAIDAAMAADTQTHYPPNAWHKPAAEDLEGGSDG